MGLRKIKRLLRLPTDRADGNLLRAQVTAAGIAVNAQLRANEARLKAKASSDVLGRLLKIMAEEKKKLQRVEGEDGEEEAFSLKDLRPSGDDSKD